MVQPARLQPEYFIYPLSAQSGYVLGDGDTITPENFWSEALGQRLMSTWGLSNGFRRVEPGDWVWAYFGGSIRRVCGLGTVQGPVEWDQDWQRYTIQILWDLHLTSRLKDDPIHYEQYRQRVQGAVVRANPATRRVFERWLRRVDPGAESDGRAVKFAQREVTQRLGQHEFRASVLRAYEGACAVTGCTERGVLQAAHIEPVSGGGDHSIANSILLRADLHNLFDLGMLTIGPDLKARVAEEIEDPTYRELNGRAVRPPNGVSKRAFQKALSKHSATHHANR